MQYSGIVSLLNEDYTPVKGFGSATYYLSSDNIRQYLGLSVGYQWNIASQKISEIMDGMVVLSKDEWKEQRDEWISVNTQLIQLHPDVAAL